MGVELRITYDGTEPGLQEHRLSLAAFQEPLRRLLTAFQRTGSAIVSDALGDPSYGSRGGKFARDAALLDLELVTIGHGCAVPTFLAVARPDPRSAQLPLFSDLPARTVERLVSDIAAEARGELQNASVRKYLLSLPSGVTRQRYVAERDGVVIAEAEFGVATPAELPPELPRLVRLRGSVVVVGFEPGAAFASIKEPEGRTTRCAASNELVERALRLRGREVEAAILESQEPRLLWIRDAAVERPRASLEQTIAHLDTRWGETLRRLAQ